MRSNTLFTFSLICHGSLRSQRKVNKLREILDKLSYIQLKGIVHKSSYEKITYISFT